MVFLCSLEGSSETGLLNLLYLDQNMFVISLIHTSFSCFSTASSFVDFDNISSVVSLPNLFTFSLEVPLFFSGMLICRS